MAGLEDFLKKINLGGLASRFKGKKDFVGLDIGAKSVKSVQVKGKELVSLGMEELPAPGPNDKETVIAAIKKIFTEHNIGTDKVVTCLSGPSVNVRYLKMPTMPDEELTQAIKWETQKYTVVDPGEVVMDHIVLKEIMEGGTQKSVIIVAVVPRSYIQEQLIFIQGAGLEPLVMDVVPFALWNSFPTLAKEDTVALVDIGAGITNINIMAQGALHFSRGISLAGNDFTSAISKEMNLPYEQAEKVKKEVGFNLEEETPCSTALKGHLERLAVECDRSFRYFLSQEAERKIDRIFLTGGSAHLKGIDKFLSRSLDLPVQIGDPLEGFQIDEKVFDRKYLEKVGVRFAVAAGLAQRDLGS